MMKIKEAIRLFKHHQKTRLKEKTRRTYRHLLKHFETQFGDCVLESIESEALYEFLESLTEGLSKETRRLRYAQLKAFFNAIIENGTLAIKNPCNAPLLSKSFRVPRRKARRILDKETVDEMIYNTKNPRDRLIMELQARCGLRIGEVLKLTVQDISDRKLILQNPKSGKDEEIAFMPAQVAKRLLAYVHQKQRAPHDKIFPICYSTARSMVKKRGAKLHVEISPHDLRRNSATFASRNGVPLEIISKVILRHQDLKTTRIYLGKVSDAEAIRWMDVLHER